MADNKISSDLSEDQVNLNSRIFDLVIGRVLKNAYFSFDQETKDSMEKTFSLGSDEDKEKFIKKNMPNFKKIFQEELKGVEEEIKSKIELPNS